ncbi:uncharacterized protein C5orf47 homolog [Sarcophilus harrisii]|uniref:uncharacterized protein C5orf47 homolog n=1 Tax=Sarcophilus harrisii TaxID=9305 RepID=UPI001301FBFF|nr:uncharacterized protein C5orf47 homolog [Sarcophilus harrisii]
MAPTSPCGRRPRPMPRYVYMTCFGSHPCRSTVLYRGQGSWRLQRHEVGSGDRAAKAAGGPSGSPELASQKTVSSRVSSPGTPVPRARQLPRLPGRAGGSQRRKTRRPEAGSDRVSDAVEFYMPLNEAAKIIKKNKKPAVWDSVYKVISKMLSENEKIRDRMNFKQDCAESGDLAQSTEESSHLCRELIME